MNTVAKGDKLENAFFSYLVDQKSRGQLVYGVHPPELCKIYQKKRYPCPEREADIEFDVVIELFREGGDQPHLYVIFECKNYEAAVSENRVTEFSDKISRIRRHNAKGVMVCATRLQSGAQKIAEKRGLGIVKFDQNGADVVAERRGGLNLDEKFVKRQIFDTDCSAKSLRFSGYFGGAFFGTAAELLTSIGAESPAVADTNEKLPFMSIENIRAKAEDVLNSIDYTDGIVDLQRVCAELVLNVEYTGDHLVDSEGNAILGLANFSKRLIQINRHENEYRERFTLAHEIGHFALQHNKYLNSESVIERDLLSIDNDPEQFNHQRLETQANRFASELLLPTAEFRSKVDSLRSEFDIQDRGHGYIYVDDQPCNWGPYNELLSQLKTYFAVSKRAIEIRLDLLNLLTDRRQNGNWKKAM